MLAGGIGITPLKGMAEYANDKMLPIQVRLLYSNRSEGEIAFRAELEELERRNPNFRVLHTLTGDSVSKGWKGAVAGSTSGSSRRPRGASRSPSTTSAAHRGWS